MTTTNDSDIPREQLLEELAYLREFREQVFVLLSSMANDIRTSVSSIRGFTDLMLQVPDKLDTKQCLKAIQRVNWNTFETVNNVIVVAHVERDPEQDPALYPYTEIDIAAILKQHIANKCERIEEDVTSVRLIVDIPTEIPSIYSQERSIDHIFRSLIEAVLKVRSKSEVRFSMQFDDQNISTTVGWVGQGPEPYLLKDFNQFPSTLTGFAFYGPSLGLYLSWRMAQQLGGHLHFEIRDQTTHLITLTLPRETRRGHAGNTHDQK